MDTSEKGAQVDFSKTPKLKAYIEQLRLKTRGLSEVEIIRYIYLDLGKRMNFDPYYAADNSMTYMSQTYGMSESPTYIEKGMKEGEVICKTACKIFGICVKELTGLNIQTTIHPNSFSNLPHVVNTIQTSQDQLVTFDLVNDTKYIQSGMRTTHFGRILKKNKYTGELETTELSYYSRERLAEIDRKCGYISDKKPYSDDYYYGLMKQYMGMIPRFKDRLNLFFTNCEQPEIRQKLGDIEAIWLHERILKSFFPRRGADGSIMYDEMGDTQIDRRISIIPGVENNGKGGERHFQMFVVAEEQKEPYGTRDIYFYNPKAHKYDKISLDKFYAICHDKRYRIPDNFAKINLLEAHEKRSQKLNRKELS